MTTTITKIATAKELRAFLARQEKARTAEFEILPAGTLAAKGSGDKLLEMISDMMSLTNGVNATRHTVNGVLQRMTVKVNYRPCVLMADAWKTRRLTALTVRQQQALKAAQAIAEEIALRRRDALERLYLLYSYVGGAIRYRTVSSSDAAAFRRMTDADSVLLNREGNCQGHSEVMYLIGTMLGFSMGIQSGISDGGGHCWNTVSFGRYVYAMDATAKISGEERRPSLKNTLHFLMGAKEAAENGLTWRPEQQTVELSAALAPQHDVYHLLGLDFTGAAEAARFVWKQRIAGEKRTQLRITARGVTVQHFSDAMKQLGADPAIQQQAFRDGTKTLSYGISSVAGKGTVYLTVEWK